jgi:hypothetical protein
MFGIRRRPSSPLSVRNTQEVVGGQRTQPGNGQEGAPRVQPAFVVDLWPLKMRVVLGVGWRESRSKT